MTSRSCFLSERSFSNSTTKGEPVKKSVRTKPNRRCQSTARALAAELSSYGDSRCCSRPLHFLQLACLFEILVGQGFLLFLLIGAPPLHVGSGVLRIEPDCLIEIRQRSVKLAHPLVNKPTIESKLGESWLHRHRLIKVVQGFLELGLLEVNSRTVFQSDGALRIKAVGFVVIGESPVHELNLFVGKSTIDEGRDRGGTLRTQTQRLREIGHSPVILTEHSKSETTLLVRLGVVGIEPNCL